MLFSTKAEYGVRLMVELGRRAGSRAPEEAEPVALATVAEAELLPLSYLEHLVAKLRQAGLVSSVREGRVLCSHETDGDACATKLLWTRVHGGVTKALSGTSLAELVEFAGAAKGAETVPEPVA